ncbi:glycoside hydrolase family 76 protein [Streptomyces sp. NBC_00441]|uniref:glycoside hydrolase family 76 protein n=1 Tax=Streptomyces sp. NBC_00441 TaxID=2975742 RepID=UPI002E2B2711|nr:glycoside hydrolase family 76 protein [Streptomyces sp. NBC_00441]
MKLSARTAVVLAAAPLLCAALCPSPALAAGLPGAGPWKDRAVNTYTALQRHLYQGKENHGLYQEATPHRDTDNAHSYLWPMREAAAATVDMAGLPGSGGRYTADAAERFTTLELYFEPRDGRPGYDSYLPAPLGQGGDVFYDDNSVVGLTLLDQYQATGDASYLHRAELTFDIVSRGWDDDPAEECPGGMHWVDSPANNMRAANVTGLAAELAARLHQETHESRYLTSAQRWYEWNWSCLRQSPGLYRNSLGDDGSVNSTLWTYNSGAMVGTAATLYKATGDRTYLRRAVQDAEGSLAYWKQGERLHDQPAIFNAIYFDNLRVLDGIHHDPAYLRAESAYAERVWKENRDPSTGLFRFQPSGGGDYDPDASAETLEQSAMVQIFAGLATGSS